VATATVTGGGGSQAEARIFDYVDGRWVSVSEESYTCGNFNTQRWVKYTLTSQPDGTQSGVASTASEPGCSTTSTVTFTRIGDVDPNAQVADPSTQSPPVVSPARALHGRYHYTETLTASNTTSEVNFTAETFCRRDSQRCFTFFYKSAQTLALTFADGQWTGTTNPSDGVCTGGTGQYQIRTTLVFPLPQPAQDPIDILGGKARADVTGACPATWDIDASFQRTGD
jgi:serine/threonine-protein kinase